MIKKSKIVVFSLTLFFVASCSVNRAVNKKLSPPSDIQWVNVEVKNPSPHTKPFPLEVRYISHKCIKKRISGFDGSVITEPSYNVIDIPLQQQKGDNWRAKVPMTGGGSCQWSLSAINLGIEYIEATHLGKDLVPGTAVGATIAFDNDADRDGRFVPSTGDLRMSPKYYPYIIERKIAENTKSLTLLGKESFLNFRVLWKFIARQQARRCIRADAPAAVRLRVLQIRLGGGQAQEACKFFRGHLQPISDPFQF